MRRRVVRQAWQGLVEGPVAYAAPAGPAWGPVLLVEHYLLLAKPLLRGLEEEGVVTHLARNGAEADARARATPYAALVVDGSVPPAGGAALVRGWREGGLTAPVLLLVPSTDEDDLLEGVEAGADDCLPLPFSLEELLARLWAFLQPPTFPLRRHDEPSCLGRLPGRSGWVRVPGGPDARPQPAGGQEEGT